MYSSTLQDRHPSQKNTSPHQRSHRLGHQGPVSWRPTTVKWRQFSQPNRHSTIGTRQTEYHEALTSSANDEMRCDCTFSDDGNASWYSVCRVPMVEWRVDCENCHLTVVVLHDTGPRCQGNPERNETRTTRPPAQIIWQVNQFKNKAFNEILETKKYRLNGKKPKQWDMKDIKHDRPDSLLSHMYKLFIRILHKWMKKVLDKNQPRERAGFKKVTRRLIVLKQSIT